MTTDPFDQDYGSSDRVLPPAPPSININIVHLVIGDGGDKWHTTIAMSF